MRDHVVSLSFVMVVVERMSHWKNNLHQISLDLNAQVPQIPKLYWSYVHRSSLGAGTTQGTTPYPGVSEVDNETILGVSQVPEFLGISPFLYCTYEAVAVEILIRDVQYISDHVSRWMNTT